MEKYIGLIDYLVLISILLTSILIGVYHGFRDNIKYFIKRLLRRELASNENDECLKTNDYLTANSSMGLVPVAFSLLASFVSATSLLGNIFKLIIVYKLILKIQKLCVKQVSRQKFTLMVFNIG